MLGLPAEAAFRLDVRADARLGHQHLEVFARGDAGEPLRDMPGWFCTQHRGECRQPLADRSRLVVDNVVNARCTALDGDGGGSRRILDMHKRPPAIATAVQRYAP